ncbi:MAG TPA: type VI secretion system protein TssA [Longimicrobium sp.]|jgi:type VI secretion system ImpA family protein
MSGLQLETRFRVDLDRFLQPLSLEKPAGESLRYDPLWQRIMEARREDDATVPQGQWQRDLKRADWKETAALCQQVLEKRSRDLQVAAWLLEAWIHLYGFAGAREGVRLIHALCQWFWEHLHPQVDPEDPEVRNAPFVWINERMSVLLTLAPITSPDGSDFTRYTWADWQEALRRENQSHAQPQSPAQAGRRGEAPTEEPDGPTRARFAANISLTPTPFFRELAADLEGAEGAAAKLQALLDERCGRDGPTLARWLDTLRQVRAWVGAVLADRPETAPLLAVPVDPPQELPMTDSTLAAPAPAPSAAPVARGGPITSRDEAYRRLSEAAEFLMRTEPHSPTPFLVKRAVAWGGMSLGELIAEFLRDGYDLKTLRVFLGLEAK